MTKDMKCKACDVLLDDYETVKKDASGDYFDLCSYCLSVSIGTLEDGCGNITDEIPFDENKIYDILT
jgi:hypothetical protein